MGNARVTQEYVEALTSGDGKGRITQNYLEVLTFSSSVTRLTQLYVEALTPGSVIYDKTASNTITFSQAVNCVHQIYLSTSNTLSLSQDLNPDQIFTRLANNTLSLSQDSNVNQIFSRSVNNTLSLIQGVIYEIHGSIFVNASNTLNLSQNITTENTLFKVVTSTLTLSQELLKIVREDLTSTLSLTQSVIVGKSKNVSANSILVFTQLATATPNDLNFIISHGLEFIQLATKKQVFNREIISPVSLNQTLLVQPSKGSTNSLSFSQTVDVVVVKGAKNTIELTQSVALNANFNRSIISQFEPFQNVVLGPNTFRRSPENILSLTQTALGYSVKGTSSTLALTQTVVVNKVRAGVNIFMPIQSVGLQKVLNRSNTNILNFNQNVSYNKVKVLSASNILSFEQHVTKTKQIFLDVSNNFILSDELVNSRYLETLTSEIIFTQTVEHQREINKPNEHNFALTQSVLLNKIIHLQASNTLVFNNSFEKYVGFLGDEDDDTITVPPAIGIIVKNIVVLKGSTRAITLPVPEFEDTDAFAGAINIVRFQTGDKKIYKTDTERRILEYTFVIQSKKVEELKAFIDEYNSKPFYLENWKGEIFFVQFTSNPFEFKEDGYWEETALVGKNKFSITLSFEGVRKN